MNVIFSREKMKALLVIVYITCSTNVGATFWNSKIKILCYGEKNIDLILTYELKDNEISRLRKELEEARKKKWLWNWFS